MNDLTEVVIDEFADLECLTLRNSLKIFHCPAYFLILHCESSFRLESMPPPIESFVADLSVEL